MVNGQALCASCNITKGDSTIMSEISLRQWQQEATRRYFEKDQQNFLAAVTPGAGKTRFALALAKRLLDEGQIRRIVVVVPSDSLRTQWADQTDVPGLHLRPFEDMQVDKPGYQGTVTTYQALGNERSATAALYRQRIGTHDNDGTLVILDEVHHAATVGGFGSGLDVAFIGAQRRLLLTGTPWRTDTREQIPYVDYAEDGLLQVDYRYTYGDALRDGIVRPIHFPTIAAKVEWAFDGEEYDAELSIDKRLKGRDEGRAVLTALDASPSGRWITDVIRRAHKELMSLRQTVPDAGGLIVARDKNHARQIANRLREETGVTAPVVVSAEDEGGNNSTARTAIEDFKRSTAPWIIAVKMIAEGVDIKRLAVGIYATNVSTELFFHQVIGRFVRTRANEDVVAQLFVPPSRNLWAIARELEATVARYLDTREQPVRDHREGIGSTRGQGNFTPLSSTAYGDAAIQTRHGVADGTAVEDLAVQLDQMGVPRHHAASMVAFGFKPAPQHREEDVPTPRHRQEKSRRKEVNSAARKLAHRRYGRADSETIRLVWNEYAYGPFGKGPGQMSLPELDEVLVRINRARVGATA